MGVQQGTVTLHGTVLLENASSAQLSEMLTVTRSRTVV
jgi:hypothetical protein